MTPQIDNNRIQIHVAPGLQAEFARRHKRSGSPTVYISDEIREALRHYQRIGLIPTRALKEMSDKPDDLRCVAISGWLSSSLTARGDHLALVLHECEQLAHDASERIPITDEMIAYMRYQERRTGVDGYTLLNRMKDRPFGLNHYAPAQWINGDVETAREHVFYFVMRAWQRLPDRRVEPNFPPTIRK